MPVTKPNASYGKLYGTMYFTGNILRFVYWARVVNSFLKFSSAGSFISLGSCIRQTRVRTYKRQRNVSQLRSKAVQSKSQKICAGLNDDFAGFFV